MSAASISYPGAVQDFLQSLGLWRKLTSPARELLCSISNKLEPFGVPSRLQDDSNDIRGFECLSLGPNGESYSTLAGSLIKEKIPEKTAHLTLFRISLLTAQSLVDATTTNTPLSFWRSAYFNINASASLLDVKEFSQLLDNINPTFKILLEFKESLSHDQIKKLRNILDRHETRIELSLSYAEQLENDTRTLLNERIQSIRTGSKHLQHLYRDRDKEPGYVINSLKELQNPNYVRNSQAKQNHLAESARNRQAVVIAEGIEDQDIKRFLQDRWDVSKNGELWFQGHHITVPLPWRCALSPISSEDERQPRGYKLIADPRGTSKMRTSRGPIISIHTGKRFALVGTIVAASALPFILVTSGIDGTAAKAASYLNLESTKEGEESIEEWRARYTTLANTYKGINPETRKALSKLDLENAISIQERIIRNTPLGEQHGSQLGNEHFVLAQLYLLKNSTREAELHLYKAYIANPSNPDIGLSLAEHYQENEEFSKAVDLYENRLIPDYAHLANQTTQPNLYKLALSSAHNDLGELYRVMGQFDKSEKHLASALTIRLKIDAPNNSDSYLYNNKSIDSLQAETLNNLGSLAADTKDINEAIFFYERAIQKKRSELEKHNTIANKSSFARTAHNYGTVLFSYGMYSQAENSFNEAITHRSQLVTLDPKNRSTQEGLANSLFALGSVYQKEGSITKAISKLDESAEHFKTLAAFSNNSYNLDLARVLDLKANILLNANQLEEALAAARIVAKTLDETEHDQTPSTFILEYLTCHTVLGAIFVARGDVIDAQESFSKANARINSLDKTFADTLNDQEKSKFVQICTAVKRNLTHTEPSKEQTSCDTSSSIEKSTHTNLRGIKKANGS